MSSIVAHASAGLTMYLCCNAQQRGSSRWAAVPFVALAVGPDLDYFAVWFFDYAADPRFSHSLLLAVGAALFVKLTLSRFVTANLKLRWLLAAGISHPLLDLLVGAHPVPLFWPLDGGVSIPTGVLPSAGSLAFDNFYLWRNLLIEMGVLGPVFTLLVAVSARLRFRELEGWTLLVLPAWAAFLTWSIALGR
ncbi:metal-dependent hydrolase [Stenotrophomonas bentonitica]